MCDLWSHCKTPNGLKTYYKCTTEQLFYIIGFDPCGFHVAGVHTPDAHRIQWKNKQYQRGME